MVILGWTIVLLLFAVGMAGTIVPWLPSVTAVYAALFAYGILVGFEPFGFWFWLIETSIALTVFAADYAIGAMGVKKFGGSRASVIGSMIGLIFGPFVIPAFGLLLGPFLGAMAGELIVGASFKQSVRSGIGAVIGFFSSAAAKIVLQLIMIVVFFIWVAAG